MARFEFLERSLQFIDVPGTETIAEKLGEVAKVVGDSSFSVFATSHPRAVAVAMYFANVVVQNSPGGRRVVLVELAKQDARIMDYAALYEAINGRPVARIRSLSEVQKGDIVFVVPSSRPTPALNLDRWFAISRHYGIITVAILDGPIPDDFKKFAGVLIWASRASDRVSCRGQIYLHNQRPIAWDYS